MASCDADARVGSAMHQACSTFVCVLYGLEIVWCVQQATVQEKADSGDLEEVTMSDTSGSHSPSWLQRDRAHLLHNKSSSSALADESLRA